jgi:hypothetical protein
MIRITSKVKIAAGVAAGALALGAAGAYAANANNTVTVAGPTYALPNGPTLISTDNKTLTVPQSFANKGECISFFAKNRDFAIAPKTGSTVSKNFHGKLISGLQSWCESQVKATTTKGSTAETETPDVEQSATPETDSADTAQAGASHGHGHGHSHAAETD